MMEKISKKFHQFVLFHCVSFQRVILPWAKKTEGTKVVIGDNLSSHFDPESIKMCIENNIRFVGLIPNSTDKCQPLDVAVFRLVKMIWKRIVEQHRLANKKMIKGEFPKLLNQLWTELHTNFKVSKIILFILLYFKYNIYLD